MSSLEATGYSKILTIENKEEAVKALKAFYLLYRPMAAINQFVEGTCMKEYLALFYYQQKLCVFKYWGKS